MRISRARSIAALGLIVPLALLTGFASGPALDPVVPQPTPVPVEEAGPAYGEVATHPLPEVDPRLSVLAPAAAVVTEVQIASLEAMEAMGIQCMNGISVSAPTKSGSVITVKGSYTRCDNTFTKYSISVVEHWGIVGFYRATTSGAAHLGTYSVQASYNCAGHGTDLWSGTISVRSADNTLVDSKSTGTVSYTC